MFHNEAYTNDSAATSADATPADQQPPQQQHALGNGGNCVANNGVPIGDGSLSPQRHQSFIVAVISAIRNAASSTTAKHHLSGHHSTVHNNKMHPITASASQTAAAAAAAASGCNNNSSSIDELAGNESDSTEMLDSETEPCLMMENVLEDVSMPDTHSHNLVSSSSQAATSLPLQPPTHLPLTETTANMMRMRSDEESIHNLSQAIYNRQQIEQHASRLVLMRAENSTAEQQSGGNNENGAGSEDASLADQPSMVSCCTAPTATEPCQNGGQYQAQLQQQQQTPLVDQIIRVDNLVTKLLKVLRIIQMDNDNCIQQLIGDK